MKSVKLVSFKNVNSAISPRIRITLSTSADFVGKLFVIFIARYLTQHQIMKFIESTKKEILAVHMKKMVRKKDYDIIVQNDGKARTLSTEIYKFYSCI